MDYIDQDDASGDIGSPERTVYKNVRDNSVTSRNKYSGVRIVDRSNIPKKIPMNETTTHRYNIRYFKKKNKITPKFIRANVTASNPTAKNTVPLTPVRNNSLV